MRGIHQWPVHSPNLQSFVSYNECAKFCYRMTQCGICIRLMNAMWDLCEGLFVLTLVLNWNLVKSRLPVFSFFRGWILMKFCTSAIFDYNVSYGRTKFCEIWVIDVIDERDIAKFQCEMEFGQIFCIVTLKWKFIILTKFSHWLHWKLSLPVQPVTKISSKLCHFRFTGPRHAITGVYL